MRRRHRHHRSWRRRLLRGSTARTALLLVLGLVVVGSIISVLTGAQDLFSALLRMPDASTIADLERKARAGR